MNSTAPQAEATTTDPGPDEATRRPLPLYRPTNDRMLGGVAAGLARYLGVDVLPVRIALVVLCFVGGVGVPLYVASWLLIPAEGADQSIAGDFMESIQSGRN